jgi:exopolysaccharide production protein ExoZ
MKKLQSLQALRGVAAIAVAAFHCLGKLADPQYHVPLGAAGIDVFFVISGIVMVLSTQPGTTPGQFLLRRFIRVVPLYWLATVCVVAYFYLRYGGFPSVEHVLASLLFLPPPRPHPFPLLYPGWTLNFEILFYLLLALSMLMADKRGFLLTATITAAISALTILDIRSGYYFLDYYLNSQMLDFSVGLIVGMVLLRGVKVSRIFGATLLAGSALLFTLKSGQSPVSLTWAGVLAAIALVIGLIAFEQAALIRSRLTQYLGDASYSIYLAHPFVLWIASILMGKDRHVAAGWIAVGASVAFGILVHRYIEKPMLQKLKLSRLGDPSVTQAAAGQSAT